jgi:hypothetical protein
MLVKSKKFIFKLQNDVILRGKSWDLYFLSLKVVAMEQRHLIGHQ